MCDLFGNWVVDPLKEPERINHPIRVGFVAFPDTMSKSNFGEEKVYSSPSLKEIRAGTWRVDLKQKQCRSNAY